MHFVDLLIVGAIFDDVVIPKVQPRHCREERAGNVVEWMEEAPIANNAEEQSQGSRQCPRHQGNQSKRHGDQCERLSSDDADEDEDEDEDEDKDEDECVCAAVRKEKKVPTREQGRQTRP